jgi:2'-5' RNA ligase
VRLFVAAWPPEDVIDLVAGLPRPELAVLRWRTRAQWHVTLRFLGEVKDVDVDAVAEALRDVSGTGPAVASLGPATAWFPGRRVLQVPVGGLDALARRVEQAISRVGHLIPRSRETAREAAREADAVFRGHLTIARVRGRGRLPSAAADQLSGISLDAEWQVDAISLVASRTGAGGSSYSDIAVFDLLADL